MRIMWRSNAPWSPSGYGEQTALFLPRIQALGHEVACLANHGLQGTAFDWNGIPVFPSNGTKDNESISIWYERFQPDVVISLFDAWTLAPRLWAEVPMAAWAPVDHFPLPTAVYAALREPNVKPIAMSRFGEHWMGRRNLEPLYVPHGVDTKLFRPQPEIKAGVRKSMGVPSDAFLIGVVAANSSQGEFPRKAYPQIFQAFAQFLKTHPDAWLYAHTKAQGAMDLDRLLVTLADVEGSPKPLLDRVKFPPLNIWSLGLPRDQLADMFCAFDVLAACSMGEGFGIPIIEAQACGVPVIASDHSAMTEITQAGWLVAGDPWWNESQAAFGFTPSVSSIVAAFDAAYEARNDSDLRAGAREFALRYDADLVTAQHWDPVLEELKKLGEPREIPPLNGKSRQVRRAEARAKAKA
jgi:glycosyltransferase involved in cell wall biosynthesis